MTGMQALKLTTPTDREVVFTRVFAAPRSRVFDALVIPDLLRRWMLGPPGWSMPVCEVELTVGGTFCIVWRSADGAEMGMTGTYREIERPHRLVHTELFDQDWTGGETVITTVLTEEDGQTTLTSTVRYASPEARDGALRAGMEQGVAASYDRLEALLAS